MRTELSVLLPTYECRCDTLVRQLHEQCKACGVKFEIIVADDGSADRRHIPQNRKIEQFTGVSYFLRPENVGRAAIRNFLSGKARYRWLLFIDGDIALNNPHLIQNYLDSEGDVVVGGLAIGGNQQLWKGNLRYRYEKNAEKKHNARHRQQQQYREFRTTNFLVSRDIALSHPFDENFRLYGYEDVLFGRRLSESGISILHIDNPVLLEDYESNELFVSKTEESLETLARFESLLTGYSNLLRSAETIRRNHLAPMVKLSYNLLSKPIKRNLKSNNPKLFLFNIYKMLYFIHIKES